MDETQRTPRVLVVTAMEREAAALRELGAVACGTGAAAGIALEHLILERTPDAVIIAGVCGGLDPSLRPGDVILGKKVLASDRPELTPQRRLFDAARRALLQRREPFVSSALLSVSAPLQQRRARTEAWNASGGAGVDMETYDLASVAEECGIPWLAVRVVLDPSSAELPSSLRSWSGEPDRDVVVRALRRPLEWPAYGRLALQMRASAASLRRAVPIVATAASKALRASSGVAERLDIPLAEASARRTL